MRIEKLLDMPSFGIIEREGIDFIPIRRTLRSPAARYSLFQAVLYQELLSTEEAALPQADRIGGRRPTSSGQWARR
jgi:hypothetical protein